MEGAWDDEGDGDGYAVGVLKRLSSSCPSSLDVLEFGGSDWLVIRCRFFACSLRF